MDCIKKKVNEELARGWIGSDLTCDYHPCHYKGQDCTFCYCPFYPCHDEDLGCMIQGRHGDVWACSNCLFIHNGRVGKFVIEECEKRGITEAGDERFKELFLEAKERFYRKGRAIMVVGATSDAGKSIAVTALCRILHRRGYVVVPFKSQNMSLNAKATPAGTEIALAQILQAKAACLKCPDSHMNPILLKPKEDTISQVMVEGKPFGDYDVASYYSDFVPNYGRRIVRENVEFLKGRYDIVVMEGAGSPAEVNIYDVDIANMGAAKEADADVVLIVNVEWGGAFAYALGTIELIPEEDRSRIKGVIFNNIRGRMDNFRNGAEMFEKKTGIPVLGCIPHADVILPSEDSEALRCMCRRGDGRCLVGVVKYPRIANFTDVDPLFLEDVSVVFVERPEDLEGVDAVVLPGTKNTVKDLLWMRENGIADVLCSLKGKVPMVGICGGYQMMGAVLEDPEGFEGGTPATYDGLGFFDMSTRFGDYTKVIRNDEGRLAVGDGGCITGYELHMGKSECRDPHLIEIDMMFSKEPEKEGSVREDEMLYGTYLHGIFDKKPFRTFFLSHVRHGETVVDMEDSRDYDDVVEDNIEALADVFEKNLDMDAILDIIGVNL